MGSFDYKITEMLLSSFNKKSDTGECASKLERIDLPESHYLKEAEETLKNKRKTKYRK